MLAYSGNFPASPAVGPTRVAAYLSRNDGSQATNATATEAQGKDQSSSVQQESAAGRSVTAAGGRAADAEQDPQVAAAVEQLRSTDRAVRAHEAAHIAAGGSYVSGAASYTYQTGPDGQRYAVGGEVSIDTSPESTPAATIRKMEAVRAAALAPADPSATDRAVAASAAQVAAQAQTELRNEQSGEAGQAAPGASAEVSPESIPEQATASSDTEQAIAGGLGSLVRATYAAANTPWTEPAFRVAA